MASSRSLGSLTLDLIANIGGFTRSMDKASRAAQKSLDDISRAAYEFGESIGKAIRLAFDVAAVYLSVDAIKSAVEQMDALNKSAQKVGLPIEQFSALAGAASLSSVATDSLVSTLGKFSSTIGKATDATSQQAKIFNALGISIKDQNGNLKSSTDLMLDFADQFKELGVNSTTTAAGIALFGKSFQDLIPFLSKGRDGIKEAEQEAIDLGATLSGQAADAASKFQDNLDSLTLAGKGFRNQLVQALLPSLNEWSNELVGLAKDHEDVQKIADGLSNTLHVLAGIAIEVAAGFKVIAATIQTLTVAIAADVDSFAHAKDIYSHPFDIDRVKGNLKEMLNISSTARGQVSDIWSTASDSLSKSLDAASKQFSKVGQGTAPITVATAQIVELSKQVNEIASKGSKGSSGLAEATKQIAALGAAAIKSGQDVAQVQSVIATGVSKLQQVSSSRSTLSALQAALNPAATAQAEKLTGALEALSNAVAKVTESANPTDKAYNTFADTARDLDQLGAKAIKAGADVKYVQSLVAKGIEGAQSKLAQDLAAPLEAARAYKDALDAQLDAQKQAADQAAAAVGMGQKQASQQAQLNKVLQDGAQAVTKFTRQHAAAIAANDPMYTQELADLKQYWKDVYDVTVQGQSDLDAAQADWLNGLKGGYQDWLSQANDVAGQWREITRGALDTATDDLAAFIDGSKSAKDAFSDFIDSTEAAITKFVAQQLLKKLMESLFGDGSTGSGGNYGWIGEAIGSIFGGGKAGGGAVQAGGMYPVNERGPELLSVGGKDFLMMGSQSGSVTPNRQLQRGGATVNNNFYMAAPTSPKTQTQVANKAAYELRRASRLS